MGLGILYGLSLVESSLSQELIDLLLDRALARARLRDVYAAQAVLGLAILKAQWAEAKVQKHAK